MSDIALLNEKWGIDGHVVFSNGAGDLPIVTLRNSLGSASIALQGAHVLSFQAAGQEPLIWMSPDASYAKGKSLRGGVPICWPWFGPHASDTGLPGHGPARTVDWKPIASKELENGSTQISLQLVESAATKAMYQHDLSVVLQVTVGSSLSLALTTTNLDTTEFTLGQALHTYFQVGDVRESSIEGLAGCTYLDKMDGMQRKVQDDQLTISQETDRVYLGTGHECSIIDPSMNRKIVLQSKGSSSTIVWNPWIATADKMGDLGKNGYLNMLCLETANAVDDTIALAAGATHTMEVSYSSSPLA